jgi:hypothetical protein
VETVDGHFQFSTSVGYTWNTTICVSLNNSNIYKLLYIAHNI